MKAGQHCLKKRGSALSARVTVWMFTAGILIFTSGLAWGQAVQAWVQRYDGGGAMAVVVDRDGNVIVAGTSAVGGDYTTIKYSAAGVPLWTNTYSSPGTGADQVVALAVDASGNVFVTGNSSLLPEIATIAYSGAGVGLWTNLYGGQVADATTDAGGNLYLAGNYGTGSSSDFLTIKYSGAGTLLWTNRYNTPADGVDVVAALAVDGSGNVYVTGSSYAGDTATNYDYATIAYSNEGVPLWTNRYNGPYGPDLPTDIAADGNGNVFVTGYSYNPNLSYSYATIAYSATGSSLWEKRYAGPVNYDDRAQALAVDTNGNVFVTGYSFASSGYGYATIKYSNNGLPLWTNRYNHNLSSYDQATAVAVDGEGDVLVTGFSQNTNGYPDYLTVKYSGSGVALWTNRYDGPASRIDRPLGRMCLAIGPGNEVYVAGVSEDDFATVKYLAAAALPATLNIERAGSQVVLTWTNAGFNLQSAPSVTGLFTNISGAASPYTNSMTGDRMYFRLQAN